MLNPADHIVSFLAWSDEEDQALENRFWYSSATRSATCEMQTVLPEPWHAFLHSPVTNSEDCLDIHQYLQSRTGAEVLGNINSSYK